MPYQALRLCSVELNMMGLLWMMAHWKE